MKKLAALILTATFLLGTGCAKQVYKNWEAAGGSRADATVEVGYIYNPQNERPSSSDAQAHAEATKRCRAWGYEEAEAFGLIKNTCQQMVMQPFVGMVCISMLVTK